MSVSGASGSERFELRRRLGAGGFGEVYEAYDRTRGRAVALKKLRRSEAGPLLRFKQEFRALADVRHPNLVRLDELMARDDEWCFTMELVDGPNLLQYVRGEDRPVDAEIQTAPTVDPDQPTSDSVPGVAAPPVVAAPARSSRYDEARLRDAFGQLAAGVQALHAAGLLHRDLKPSNVLVGRDGRVVILDFGLVADLADEDAARSVQIVGTPAYMSPEQAGGREVSRASDWYSVGVMLFEALTGRLPFEGALHDVIVRRQSAEAPRPRDLAPEVPADLDALCHELLRLDPGARPAGNELLARFQRRAAAACRVAPLPELFVGRQVELAALGQALERVRAGQSTAVLVSGASGMGKTALVRRFLAELRGRDPSALVLSGRCYQRETVPYKALDSLVDGLGRYLGGLPALEAARYLPRERAALARLFPVLREVGETGPSRRAAEIPDVQELRRRALAGLKELLGRLADQLTVVLFVDDLQWGDLDSGLLLRELLRPPDPPPVLLVACFRREDAGRSPLLRTIVADADLAEVRQLLEIGELPPAEAEELALARLGGRDAAARVRAGEIARESGGSPYFVDELARHQSPAAAGGPEPVRLDAVIQARVAQLPEDARRLLEVVVVAGEPLDLEVARRAAELGDAHREAFDALQAEHWVRPCALDGREAFEPFHDRVRESVVAIVPEERHAAHHRRLAAALELAGTASPATLAEHWMGAGERERAASYAVRAADQAAAELAFDRAAKLYELALDAGRWSTAEIAALRAKRGEALVNAGRGADAAREFLAAAPVAGPGEGRELRRRAAEQLLITGHIDAGREVLQAVLAAAGLRLAPTPARALAGLLARRLQLAARGLRFTPRPAGEVAPGLLARVDASWAASVGLGMVDTIRGAHFQALNLLDALRAGEPRRVARALAMEMAFSSSGGGRTRRRTAALHRRCRPMVESLDDHYTSGLFAVYEGMIASFEGRWDESLVAAARGEAILRERCTGATWELDSAQLYQLHALANAGRWRELAARAPALLHEANGRGDLYLATYIRARNLYLLHLAADDSGAARAQQERSLDGWSQRGFQVQHYWDWFARGEIDLYTGDPRAVWDRLRSRWGDFRRSLLPRAQAVYLEAICLRPRAAIALAVQSSGAEWATLLRHAERDARRLEREAMAWGDAMATLVRAGVAATGGDSGRARELAADAQERLTAVGMAQFAAAARWRRGQVSGGADGEALVAEARAWFEGQGVRNPERMVGMLVPGRWDAPGE